MNYTELAIEDFEFITKTYQEAEIKDEAQELLSDKYDVSKRTIRNWLLKMGLTNTQARDVDDAKKILIFDIETNLLLASVFWSGEQYIKHTQLRGETKVITVAWTWLGENTVHHLVWDENQSDEKLLKEFATVYNEADLVVGINNNNFDNRILQARFAKFNIPYNVYVRSFDIQKTAKKYFRIPSYSLAYMTAFFNVPQKLNHEGVKMWELVQWGTPEEQKEYLQKMVEYNIGDIISTAALYIRLRPFFGHTIHLGVGDGEPAWSCPDTGSTNVELYKTTITKAGTIQRIMISHETGRQYKINNRQYLAFIDFHNKLNNEI